MVNKNRGKTYRIKRFETSFINMFGSFNTFTFSAQCNIINFECHHECDVIFEITETF